MTTLAEMNAVTARWTRSTTVEEMRRDWDALFWSDAVPVETTRIIEDGVKGDWLTPPNAVANRAILYLHGGGFSIGSSRSHHDLAARIATAARSSVLVLDYRRAPECRFPAPISDAFNAALWLRKKGDLVIAGDSAGGHIALTTLIALEQEKEPLPRAAVLLSPWLDLTTSLPSYEANATRDPQNRRHVLEMLAQTYLRSADPADASPLLEDLKGLPPMLVQVGADEIIVDDARELAKRAPSVTLEEWPGMVHVFQQLDLPEARRAIDSIGAFIEREWAT